MVLAIDAKRKEANWEVFVNGGRTPTGLSVLDWIQTAIGLGCGELLVTSIDQDGVRTGFDLPLVAAIASFSKVPLIASGGAGNSQHFADVLKEGMADAALAAGIFHEGLRSIPDLKSFLRFNHISVR